MDNVKSNRKLFIAFTVFVAFFTSYPLSFYGLNFSDAGFIYRSAERLLEGEILHRNFILNVGYIPILFDALFQKILGSQYSSSIFASIALKVLTILIFYLILEKLSSPLIAFFVSSVASITQYYAYHNSFYEANLFVMLSILFYAIYLKNNNRLFVFFIGILFALMLFSRQSAGVICLSIMLFSMILIDVENKFEKNQTLFLFLGLILGLALLSVYLIMNDIFLLSMKQMFLDAKEKKAVTLLNSILDMTLGGLTEIGKPTNIPKAILVNNLIPLIFSVSIIRVLFFDFTKADVLNSTIKVFVIALSVVCVSFSFYEILEKEYFLSIYCALIGLSTMYLSNRLSATLASLISSKTMLNNLNVIGFTVMILPFMTMLGFVSSGFLNDGLEPFILTYDFPRVFFTVCLMVLIFSRDKCENAFGFNYKFLLIAILFVIGSTWSRELSHPQRGWIDTSLLFPLSLLFGFGSNKVSLDLKKQFSIFFAILISTSFAFQIFSGKLIVGGESVGLYDGTLRQNKYSVQNKKISNFKVRDKKKQIIEVLEKHIQPGDTCFIYGAAPLLYSILECKNVSQIDSCLPDLYIAGDAVSVSRSLVENPPKWIIQTGILQGSPPLHMPDAKPDFGPYNQVGAMILNDFMKGFSSRYYAQVPIFLTVDKAEVNDLDRDKEENIRLYKFREDLL